MSYLPADLIIYLLLLIGAGFSGIGVIGLLLFPDLRSRRYTAFRASLIGLGATGTAVIIYAMYQFLSTSRSPYLGIVLHALILLALVFAANLLLTREILTRAIPESSCDLTETKEKVKSRGKK